jgi:hypothetical protein
MKKVFLLLPLAAMFCGCGAVATTSGGTATHSAQASSRAKASPSTQATPTSPPTPDPAVVQQRTAASAFDQVDRAYESKSTPGYDTLNIDLGAQRSDAVIIGDCRSMVSILGALVTGINKIDFPFFMQPEAAGVVSKAQTLSAIFSSMADDVVHGKLGSFNKAWDSTDAAQHDLDFAIRSLRSDLQLQEHA